MRGEIMCCVRGKTGWGEKEKEEEDTRPGVNIREKIVRVDSPYDT